MINFKYVHARAVACFTDRCILVRLGDDRQARSRILRQTLKPSVHEKSTSGNSWKCIGPAAGPRLLNCIANGTVVLSVVSAAPRTHTDDCVDRGRLAVRERIRMLLDPDTALLEFSPLGGHDMYEFPVPCAGIVTGIGRVSGVPCVIVANDPTVKVSPPPFGTPRGRLDLALIGSCSLRC